VTRTACLSRALFVCAILLAATAADARADVRLSALFSDRAILQRDRPLPIWGWATPGEKVTVALGTESGSSTAGGDGRWQVTLKPQPVSKTPLTLTVTGKNTITVKDVLLGDVWLCGGQSNMEWSLGGCDAPDDIRTADLPLIRQFGVEYNFATTPQTEVKGNWLTCSPLSAPGFNAVGFYFARRVQKETGVPIGLLRSCIGGTNIELWMSQETLMNTPALAEYGKFMRDSLAIYQKDLAASLPTVEAWTAKAREELKAGRPVPPPPALPEFPFGEKMYRPRCVTLHNGMIAPLVPFALRGVLWYQGESNAGGAGDAQQYIEKKRAMLADWRKWFRDPNLPFYFVQLAAWQKASDDPVGGDGWALLRDAQRKCLTMPNTGMAVATDIGDAADIHPKNKSDVGDRLARWALANQYGKKIEASGPLFRDLKIEANKAIVSFDHVGGGLIVASKDGLKPPVELKAGKLTRFAIAGKDRKWVWADAKIEGDTVVCTHPDVPLPVAVRYAFTINPAGANLYNRDGLPASPFRTDDW
jgi:sialate O-acetylesterase